MVSCTRSGFVLSSKKLDTLVKYEAFFNEHIFYLD